jgi:hypothetical protein
MALPFCLLLQAYFEHSSAGTPESKDDGDPATKKAGCPSRPEELEVGGSVSPSDRRTLARP